MVTEATPGTTLDKPDVESDFDLFMLIENFNAPHCEANHQDSNNLKCTHQPVARYNSCTRHHVPVCQAAVDFVHFCYEQGKAYTCAECGKPCEDDWWLEPLSMGAS
jgi:hypothetical protein